MKKVMMIMVLGALVACLVPQEVQAQDWQTNTMQGSGSAYSSQVTPVGAQDVQQQATTTYSAPRHISGRRNIEEGGGHTDPGEKDEGSPIGSEWALLLFAALAGGGVFLRGRKLKIGN